MARDSTGDADDSADRSVDDAQGAFAGRARALAQIVASSMGGAQVIVVEVAGPGRPMHAAWSDGITGLHLAFAVPGLLRAAAVGLLGCRCADDHVDDSARLQALAAQIEAVFAPPALH